MSSRSGWMRAVGTAECEQLERQNENSWNGQDSQDSRNCRTVGTVGAVGAVGTVGTGQEHAAARLVASIRWSGWGGLA